LALKDYHSKIAKFFNQNIIDTTKEDKKPEWKKELQTFAAIKSLFNGAALHRKDRMFIKYLLKPEDFKSYSRFANASVLQSSS